VDADQPARASPGSDERGASPAPWSTGMDRDEGQLESTQLLETTELLEDAVQVGVVDVRGLILPFTVAAVNDSRRSGIEPGPPRLEHRDGDPSPARVAGPSCSPPEPPSLSLPCSSHWGSSGSGGGAVGVAMRRSDLRAPLAWATNTTTARCRRSPCRGRSSCADDMQSPSKAGRCGPAGSRRRRPSRAHRRRRRAPSRMPTPRLLGRRPRGHGGGGSAEHQGQRQGHLGVDGAGTTGCLA
jgi:hypothetical protein